MKKKLVIGCILLVFISFHMFAGEGIVSPDTGLSHLAEKSARAIGIFFYDKHNVNTGIIRYDNYAGVSDLVAQKFYQLMVTSLENPRMHEAPPRDLVEPQSPMPAVTSPAVPPVPVATTDVATKGPAVMGGVKSLASRFKYRDLMINFSKSKGEFNLNRIHQLNYLIYIKLTRNKNKLGVGISIFSRISDMVVFIKYVQSVFSPEEREIFETTRFGFKSAGYSRIIQMDARADLLDFRSFSDAGGKKKFLFYYPDKLEVFRVAGSRLTRVLSFPLRWDKPVYPVMVCEGRMAHFLIDSTQYVTLGNNFSRSAKVLTMTGDNLQEKGTVDFIPFRRLTLNQEDYLAGARYSSGKNYFEGNLLLAPVSSLNAGRLIEEKQAFPFFTKVVPPFMALDFSTVGSDNRLDSVHLIDRQYHYRYLADNFEELTAETPAQRGASACTLDGQWLAVSDYSSGYDTLYFYKIENGSRRLVFQNSIAGEIVFIADGFWKAAKGFWVYVKQARADQGKSRYLLQFWSKKSE